MYLQTQLARTVVNTYDGPNCRCKHPTQPTKLMIPEIIVRQIDHTQHIRIDRPDKRNALTRSMYAALTQALHDADGNPDVRCIVLSGTNDCFSAGNDLNDFLTQPPTGTDDPIFRFVDALPSVEKPLIASVNGVAVGIGTTLLLHCDLVYAGPEATFHMPFVNLGLVPEAGASLILPLLAGQRNAAELFLLGDRFDANRALHVGIVNRVCSQPNALETALTAAAHLAEQPYDAVIQTKNLLKQHYRAAIKKRIRDEAALFIAHLNSDKAQQALKAFLTKSK